MNPAAREAAARCLVILLSTLLAASGVGCKRDNPYYCENPVHTDCIGSDAAQDATPDSLPRCNTNQECSGDTSVCDLDVTRMCVRCTATDRQACVGAMPACSNDHVCVGCSAHDQCNSKACLPDGSCGDDVNVAYVDAAGSGSACTSEFPCKRVADGLATNRPYVKLQGTTDEAVTIDNGRVVTFLADPGAKLVRTTGGALLEVYAASHVTIYDLEISGASGSNGPGISIPPSSNSTVELIRSTVRGTTTGAGIAIFGNGSVVLTDSRVIDNSGGGILAAGTGAVSCARSEISDNGGDGITSPAGGTVSVTRSKIADNLGVGVVVPGGVVTVTQSTVRGNSRGGVDVTNAEYRLSNNLLVRNGTPTSLFGGVRISQIGTVGTHVFEFNTMALNTTSPGGAAGVICNAVTAPLAFTNSIVYGNGLGSQVDGANCNWSYSNVGPSSLPGASIIASDPLFVAPSEDNFQLQATSPDRDAADPAATLEVDIDGTSRPQGARRDMGAVEMMP